MIVLSMATGSCGTGYVAKRLDLLEGVSAVWEEKKNASEHILRKIHAFDMNDVREETWKIKLNKMKQMERESGLYVEISHRLIKGWLQLAVRDIPKLKVINVTRNMADVAINFCRAGYFDVRGGKRGVLAPFWKHNIVKFDDIDKTSLEKAVWYVIETEMRKLKFMKDYPHIPVYTFRLEYRKEDWDGLLEFLGLERNDLFNRVVDKDGKTNPWRGKRQIVPLCSNYTVEDAQRVIDKFKIEFNPEDQVIM